MSQEEQLQSEIEFLRRAIEGEVENTAEAMKEAQVGGTLMVVFCV